MIEIEELNIPGVLVCNEGFLIDAKSSASAKNMPGIRIVPGKIPCECTVSKDIRDGVDDAIDKIIIALTKPLVEEEKSPKSKQHDTTSGIAFKGNFTEINRFFYWRGWGDGLPIVPPTEEAVKEMLSGTDLSPDHVVTRLLPRMGKATVEKIAINAVMAGALPTYMPLLIAGTKALMEHKAVFGTWSVSTGSWSPFWIINGPIRNQLHINSGSGSLNPGDIANATIGRAMGLIIKNIGGIRKGIEDMGTLGNPGKYSMVIAENEEENPWEPLHVGFGFKKEDNVVSVTFPNCYLQVQPWGTDDSGVLNGITYNIFPGSSHYTLMLPPTNAQTLAKSMWTKKSIKAYIAEYARIPAYKHQFYDIALKGQPNIGGVNRYQVPNNPTESMRIILDPEWINVIVAGGVGVFMGICGGGTLASMKVELPANWETLVNKYKDLVPSYFKY